MASTPASRPASAAIGPDEVRVTAEMARLHVDASELDRLAGELSGMLGFAAHLGEVDVTGVEPMTHAVPMSCPLRDDVVGAHDSTEAALRNAPATDGAYFTVPAILPAGSGEG